MTLKTKLLGAGAALLLSTGAALAVPATAQTDLNVRSGPGTQYPVVGSIQGGETVDVGSCTGSWCRVSFSGGSGYASRSYLAMGGGAPGPAVAAAPYVYDDERTTATTTTATPTGRRPTSTRTRASGTGIMAGTAGRAGTAAELGWPPGPAGRHPPVAGQPAG